MTENITTPAPMEFVEAALHEIDEELCRDDLEELCYVAPMSRKEHLEMRLARPLNSFGCVKI